MRLVLQAGWILFFVAAFGPTMAAEETGGTEQAKRLQIEWDKKFLTIRAPQLPGKTIRVNYLEAYCRPGSTDREWGKTVIGHRSELLSTSEGGSVIRLRDTLDDRVIVEHTITAKKDEVDFRLIAKNPTRQASHAHWAQPCIRLADFLEADPKLARKTYPPYIRQCFMMIDGELTRLPTRPWATDARYTPGQVYCPRHVPRDDVNPRPLSELVPSSSLCGCFSPDSEWILATAWEPYQEIFQGVITCMHTDFRIGGLEPGETKEIRGKIYLVPGDTERLLRRFERDFPEQAKPEQR